MDITRLAEQLSGWIPIRLYKHHSTLMADWCYLGTRRFSEPFFNQTIQDCLRHPFNVLFRHQTPIETLGMWHEVQPGLSPSGFMFHMSRCGSTLMSQMLAALPHNIVISEAGPIDSVLRTNLGDSSVTDERRVRWFQWVVSALGQRRTGQEQHFFIKFDSWNMLHFSLIHRAFPSVPWIFVYRDPIEVLVSQLRRRGAHMVPGVIEPALFDMDATSIIQMPPEEYCARVLAKICQAALQQYNPMTSLFIHYDQLPQVSWSSVIDLFGMTSTHADVERMQTVAQLNAKNPRVYFESDTVRKRREASHRIREMAMRWVAPLYEELEAIRLSRDKDLLAQQDTSLSETR